ncbi:MAG: response regulator transcription factor [Flavipsychrobacter sp.]|jgi:DNA-binding LytR/AlgR family response regulator|nr:response regulator transcription factor [Flavipsychrobacter sp.]
MQSKMNCLIADDEELAQHGLAKFIAQVPFLNVVGTCSNGYDIAQELKKNTVDLLFLDIQMPKMTGIEFLNSNKSQPLTIVTTAYPDYALAGYEYDIVDYLLKPIPFDRFVKSATKAKELFDLKQKAQLGTPQETFFFIKANGCFEKIFYDEILYVRAMQNYVVIQTQTKRHTVYLTVKNVGDYLPPSFIKVNKSYIVSIDKVDRISRDEIIIGEHAIPISRSNKDQVLNAIINERLLTRK